MEKKIFLIKKIIIAFLLSTSILACQDLEEEPKYFVSPDDFYTTPSQVEAVFASAMNQLWNMWGSYSYGFGFFQHDDQLVGGDLNIPPSHASALWKAHYAALMNINSAIGALNKGSVKNVSQNELDELMGQAKFLRAYNYFMLVRMFGGVPLLTENSSDPVRNPVPRSSIAEVYALIVSDFEEAAAKLPTHWPGQPGRPARNAAKALLAKVYLTMATAPLNDLSKYEKAAAIALEVMESGEHTLIKNVADVFAAQTKYSSEMMWNFNSNYEDLATDPYIWTPGMLGGWGDFSVEPVWEQNYPEQPRKAAYLLTEINGVHYTEWPGERRPYIKKYQYDSESDYNANISIINIPIIRYADVLLIFAEAENMSKGGPTTAAVGAINKVIDRANDYEENPLHPRLTTNMTKEAFDAAVIEERNLELCFEYDRWFDLVRKRLLKDKNPQWESNFSEDDYLFPIPEIDLRLNRLLVQNPGYHIPGN